MAIPKKHHIDRRADAIVGTSAGSDDEMLSTIAVAAWLGLSKQFLDIGRHRGYGPKFTKLSARCIRYRRGDVLAWLKRRTYSHTAQYRKSA